VADVPRERLRRTRGQDSGESKVIDTGPYAIVRHPMYASVLLLFIGIPLLLGSWLGLVLAVLFIVGIAWRANASLPGCHMRNSKHGERFIARAADAHGVPHGLLTIERLQ
jgi:Phospholipid methyltransferase